MNQDHFDALQNFIIKTRSELGLSQAQVARRGGIPKGTIGAIEAGRRAIPRQETLQGLARGLGVPYDVLDRLVRGLPAEPAQCVPMPGLGERELALITQVDGLSLDEHHRKLLKEVLRTMMVEMLDEERSRRGLT